MEHMVKQNRGHQWLRRWGSWWWRLWSSLSIRLSYCQLPLPHIGVIIIMLSSQSPSSRDTRDDSMMRKNGYEKMNEEKEDSQSKVMLLWIDGVAVSIVQYTMLTTRRLRL